MEPHQPASNSGSYEVQSPYAPPPSAVTNTGSSHATKTYAAEFPFRLTVFSACIATAVLAFGFIVGMNTPLGGLTMAMPFVSTSIFVSACMKYFEAGGAAARSAGWKALMVMLIPAASVLLFVPTCFGTGMAMFIMASGAGMYGSGGGAVFMLIPFFAGYLATFSVIAMRLRYRMPKPTVEEAGPWTAIADTRSSDTVPTDPIVPVSFTTSSEKRR